MNDRPVTLSDVPGLRQLFRKSTWRDMSLRRFFRLIIRPKFQLRLWLSLRDAVKYRRFGIMMGRYSKRHEGFTYVYIGANDGLIGDTIMPYASKYGWSGVLVEPVPHIMKQLKKNYGHLPRHVFEEAAIGSRTETREIYVIKETGRPQPAYAQILHSFSKEHLMNQHISWGVDKESDIESIRVKVLSFEDLVFNHGLNKIDLIVIDTEGADFEILDSMEIAKYKPKFLKFEYQNMTKRQLDQALLKLRRVKYKLHKMRGDYFCILDDD